MRNTSLGLVIGLALTTTGCKLVDKIKDAADGENESYCEAVCEWAVSCVDGETDITADEAMARCLEATEASDPDCGGAEDGIAIEDAALLNECTAAQKAQDCSALTGNEAAIMSGAPPVATCMIGYGGGADSVTGAVGDLPASATELTDVQVYVTYNEARNAVLETGSEVCERFEETVCDYAVDCLEDKGGIDVGDEIRQTAYDQCVERLFGSLTDDCITNGRYDSFLPVDYNVARYSAEECMDGFDETAAADGACAVFSSTPDAICAGAFSTPEQVETLFNGAISFLGDYDVTP